MVKCGSRQEKQIQKITEKPIWRHLLNKSQQGKQETFSDFDIWSLHHIWYNSCQNEVNNKGNNLVE